MNRAIRYGLIISAAAASLLACQKKRQELAPETRTVQIRSVVANEETTKAIATQSSELTAVRFLRLDGLVAPTTSMSGASSYLGDRAADGSITWTEANPPIYDRTGLNSYLVAYHPSGAGEVPDTKIDWTIDGKTDLLLSQVWDAGAYSKPKTGAGAGETPLTLDHMLAQIAVVFQAQPGVDLARVQEQYGKIVSLTLRSTLPTATYTYATNAVTYSGTSADVALWQGDCHAAFDPLPIPASDNTTINAAALLAPGSGTLQMILATEKVASIPINVQLATEGADKDFERGKKHIVTIRFKIENAEVEVLGCSIVDWTIKYTAPDSGVEI